MTTLLCCNARVKEIHGNWYNYLSCCFTYSKQLHCVRQMECIIPSCPDRARPGLIKSSRIAALKAASLKRDDGLACTLKSEHFMCHKTCVMMYTSDVHIKRLLSKRRATADECDSQSMCETKRRRSNAPSFSFKENCLFCGDTCEVTMDRKNPKRWRPAYVFRTGTHLWQKTSKVWVVR